MSTEEAIKYDNPIDLKEHIELLKKACKNGQPYKIMVINADYLNDKSIHFEIIIRANKDGITKTFSTYISRDMYEKTIKPLYMKINEWTLPNKRNPDNPPYVYPIYNENVLEAVAEEDLSKFFDDFIGEKE